MNQAAAGASSAAKGEAGERKTIHIVLHEAKDTVGVAVIEGIKAGSQLNAWIMDEDEIVTVNAKQDIPIGHKVALKDMAVGDTVLKYGIDMGKVASVEIAAPSNTAGTRSTFLPCARLCCTTVQLLKPISLIAIWPWSWYMVTMAWYRPSLKISVLVLGSTRFLT